MQAGSVATVALILGTWVCVSAISTPLVVILLRREARANGRLTTRLRREGWIAVSEAAPISTGRMLAS